MFCLDLCLCTTYVPGQRSEDSVGSPGTGATDYCEPPCGWLSSRSWTVILWRAASVLTSEPSLQPHWFWLSTDFVIWWDRRLRLQFWTFLFPSALWICRWLRHSFLVIWKSGLSHIASADCPIYFLIFVCFVLFGGKYWTFWVNRRQILVLLLLWVFVVVFILYFIYIIIIFLQKYYC